jgi:putative Ca2+/H+ antiporter (TMEM165/GDT1 family)
MFSVFVLTYGAVFAAELVGDKLLYTTSVLAARFRALPIAAGAGLAFAVKTGVAVFVGASLSRFPKPLIVGITTLSFGCVAYAVIRRPEKLTQRETSNGALTSFVVVLGSEWADLGQITTATMAARFGAPLGVWLGAASALITKACLAACLGAGVCRWFRNRLSPRTIRFGSAATLLLLGALSVAESLMY